MEANRSMSRRMFISVCCLIFLGLFSCGNEHRLGNYPDPYMDSFRDQRIKFMIAYDPSSPDITDTTFFNETGDEIQHRGYGRMQEKIEYDSLHFIKHQLILNDIPGNFVYEYSFDKNGILNQECREVQHLNWRIEKSDKSTPVRTVFFEVNEQGQVIKETDTTSHQISVYSYGEQGNLLSREFLQQDLKPSGYVLKYEYYEPLKLKIIRHLDGDRKITEQFFSVKGILDSTVRYDDYGKKDYAIRYRYVYY